MLVWRVYIRKADGRFSEKVGASHLCSFVSTEAVTLDLLHEKGYFGPASVYGNCLALSVAFLVAFCPAECNIHRFRWSVNVDKCKQQLNMYIYFVRLYPMLLNLSQKLLWRLVLYVSGWKMLRESEHTWQDKCVQVKNCLQKWFQGFRDLF